MLGYLKCAALATFILCIASFAATDVMGDAFDHEVFTATETSSLEELSKLNRIVLEPGGCLAVSLAGVFGTAVFLRHRWG